MRMELSSDVLSSRLIVLVCVSYIAVCQGGHVIVSTKYGPILGLSRHFPNATGNVTRINKFLGVPYASPPLGELRFSPPVPPKPWDGIYNGTFFRSICYQDPEYNKMFWKNFDWPQSEDCLYMNIYSPNTTGSEVYPVMVYIHGGGYEAGSPIVSPGDALPLWEVVLVTIQYRLGPFGFMTTGDAVARGNYGMLDQIESLKWVKENIESFKGDPTRVTIFGESAGGSSVGLLLLSPLSKGLFHYAISLSGIDFSPFAINQVDEGVELTKRIADDQNCPTHDSKQMISCLRRLDGDRFPVIEPNKWRPLVDGHFLLDTPANLRKQLKFHPYPFMAGLTSDEGSYFFREDEFQNVDFDSFKSKAIFFYKSIRRFGRGFHQELAESVSEAIVFQYSPWPDTTNKAGLRRGMIDMITDYSIAAPAHAVLDLHSKVAPTYLYVFSHRSKDLPRPLWMGVGHKADTPYEFAFPFLDLDKTIVGQEFDDVDRNVSDIIIRFFTNFARTGNPTAELVSGVSWSQYNETHPAYMNITAHPQMELNFHEKSMAFWNTYYPKLLNVTSCPEGPDVFGSTSTGTKPSWDPNIILILAFVYICHYL